MDEANGGSVLTEENGSVTATTPDDVAASTLVANGGGDDDAEHLLVGGEGGGDAEKKVKKKKKKSGSGSVRRERDGSKKVKKKERSKSKAPVPSLDLDTANGDSAATTPSHTEDEEEDDDDDAFLPRRSISVDGEEIFTDEDVQNYPFSEPDAETNILFVGETAKTSRPVVKAGTLEKLIQRLTWEAYPDPVYMNAFLLTYRSFTTPQELLQLLKLRYNVPLPTRANSSELEQFIKAHQNPIRLRVFNVAKRWLSDHFYDFVEDRNLVTILNDTIIRAMLTSPDVSMQKAGEQLNSLLKQKVDGIKKEMKIQFNKPPPPTILPAGFNPNGSRSSVKWMDVDPVELARQLTLIEYSLYRAIKPQECLGQAWTKKTTRDDKAKNIMMMIQRFNQVSHWVTTEVVKVADMRARAAVLARFIDLASACEKLNNYNATMEILSGLQCSAIYRLKHTWTMLKKEHKKKWKEVTELLAREQNFQKFREHLHSVDPPCIPYLGVYLTDLTFIEDGNKDFINDSLINFDKRRKIAQVIMEIQQYQATPYCLEEVPALREFLLNLETFDENEAYTHSLQVEPKGMAPPPKAMGASWNGFKAKALKKIEKSKQAKESAGQKEKEDKPDEEEEEEEEDWGELEELDDYPFSKPDAKDNIVLDVDVSAMIEGAVPTIKAATLEKLIEKLTNERYCDPALVDSFLLTHGMFSTSDQVMALLKKRFTVPLPRDTANKDLQDRYYQAKVLPVRLRVFNMAKHWIDRYSHRCLDDERFMKEVDDLAHVMLDAGMEKVAATLKHSIQRQKEGGYSYEAARRQTLSDHSAPDAASATSEDGSLSFHDVDPEELACQLTLTQQRLYNAIRPWEVLAHGCVKRGEEGPAKAETPQYHALLEHNERLVGIVVSSIVSQDTTEAATAVISKWVRVADKCLGHNNFNAIVHILAALQQSDVAKVMWAGLPFTTKAKINKMKDMIDADNHFSKLQDKLHRSQPPCIPHIGAFVGLIAEHFEKMPDKVQGLINFEKFSLISAEVSEFQQYQPIPYTTVQPAPTAQRWLALQRVMSPEEVTVMAAKLGSKRPASKTMLLTKIEQRRSQHSPLPVSLERSSSFSADSPSVEAVQDDLGDDAGREGTLGSSSSGLGSSPSMTKKLKKAFSSNKPSTISRTSSVRSSRTTPPSPVPLIPVSPLTARASVKSTGYSTSPVGATSGGVKEEFVKLFKQDAEFRQAVLAEVVQSQEMQDLLRTEREEAHRHLQNELKQFKEAIMSEVISSCCALFQQPPSGVTASAPAPSSTEATGKDGKEKEEEEEPSKAEAPAEEEKEKEKAAAAPIAVESGDEMKPKPKLHLPDFG